MRNASAFAFRTSAHFAVATALFVALFLGAVASIAPAAAGEIQNYTVDGVAIGGTDPVGYFTDGDVVKGSADFAHEYDGVVWHFANAANRDAFAADPAKYAPAYGGYCAYGVSLGSKFETDPHAWTIVDGKLYLNKTLTVRDIWSEDIPGNLQKADANWNSIRDVPAGDL